MNTDSGVVWRGLRSTLTDEAQSLHNQNKLRFLDTFACHRQNLMHTANFTYNGSVTKITFDKLLMFKAILFNCCRNRNETTKSLAAWCTAAGESAYVTPYVTPAIK